MSRLEEVLIPLPAGDNPASHVRSTLVLSSVQSLRAKGLFERYESLLDPAMRETIQSLIAGVWLPMETGLKHYRACEAMGIPFADQVTIGHEVGNRIQSSILGLLLKGAKGVGATPWTGLGYLDRLWERVFSGGGGVGLTRLGPKEARVEIAGLPLLAVPYFRHAFRGTMSAGLELFCARVYVQEITRSGRPDALPGRRNSEAPLLLRVSWA